MAGKNRLSKKALEAKAREEAALLPKLTQTLTAEESRLMLHELSVHQIELEMQNEELRKTQIELQAARQRYFELYDLAPVGYCTLSKQGWIAQANLTAGNLLGVGRNNLLKQVFTRFIFPEDQDTYYLHRKQLLESGDPQTCELRMVNEAGTPFWVHLAASAASEGEGETPVLRVVMMRCDRTGTHSQ